MARYYADDPAGWVIEEWPDWETPIVHCWRRKPEVPEDVKKEDPGGMGQVQSWRSGMTAHRYGARYETCTRCGREWNVSIWAPMGEYLCPVCTERERKEKRKARIKNKNRKW